MSRWFLERIHLVAFGSLSQKFVGPLKPGMNVVYGKNETGKTTIAAFIESVLFGWPRTTMNQNDYKPLDGQRAGTLFFENTDGEEASLSRNQSSKELQGDTWLLEDIDKETYSTIFSLTSDELRSLANTSDITAKLLTAGSGTASSPAHALRDIQKQIDEYTSRSSAHDHSLVLLREQQKAIRAKIISAAEEANNLKHKNKDFHDLEFERNDVRSRLQDLQTEISELTACKVSLNHALEDIHRLQEDIVEIKQSEEDVARRRAYSQVDKAPLVSLNEQQDRSLRDMIERYEREKQKHDRAVDLAENDFANSLAAFNTTHEIVDTQAAHRQEKRVRGVQIALSVFFPLLFIGAGIPLFVHGRTISSMSFTALGAGLVLFSLMLALGALVMLFKSGGQSVTREDVKESSEWVLRKDQKKLEVLTSKRKEFLQHMKDELDRAGLEHAEGSLSQARTILDEARTARAQRDRFDLEAQSLVSRRTEYGKRLQSAQGMLNELCEKHELDPSQPAISVEVQIDRKEQQRRSLEALSENLDKRYGELKQELTSAQDKTELADVKLQNEQLTTRITESAENLARLLLAKRMLEGAIAAWDETSQPEVYKRASQLFELMTDGAWVKISLGQDGRLQVTNALKITRDPKELSLGTCQQMYLALRLALLMTAENVGAAFPVVADDILVNFDNERRMGAAKALLELAKVRQVVLFTCHSEVVDALYQTGCELNELTL